MCQIVICNNRRITTEEINSFWNSNSDGAGVIYSDAGAVKWKKGFMRKEELKSFVEKLVPPYVIHFRAATHGSECPELTHPFLVSMSNPLQGTLRDGQYLLMHNGVDNEAIKMLMVAMFIIGKKWDFKEMSDTRAIAILLSVLGVNAITQFSGKFVIVDHKFNIRTYGQFIEKNGILLSNGTQFYLYDRYDYATKDCIYKDNPESCPTKNYSKCPMVWRNCPYPSWYTEE
jgi:predicted glutamine amidotransferase